MTGPLGNNAGTPLLTAIGAGNGGNTGGGKGGQGTAIGPARPVGTRRFGNARLQAFCRRFTMAIDTWRGPAVSTIVSPARITPGRTTLR